MGVFHDPGLYTFLPSIDHHTGKLPPDWSGFRKLRLSPAMPDAVSKFGDDAGFYNIQLTPSHDPADWRRVAERAPFLEASPLGAGAYDTRTIIGPSAPVVRDDELWFYDTGIRHYAFVASGNEPGYDDWASQRSVIERLRNCRSSPKAGAHAHASGLATLVAVAIRQTPRALGAVPSHAS